MKRFFLPFLIFAMQFSFAQSADKGRVNFYLSGGFGLYKTAGNANVNVSGQALAQNTIIGLDYNAHKQISIGLEAVGQNFVTNDSSKIINVGSGMLGVNIKFHFLNKEKSSAYIGTSVGGFDFEYEVIDSLSNTGQLKADGIYNTFYLGYNKYFGKVFGLSIQAGLINQPMQMNSLSISGEVYETWHKMPVDEWKILMRGIFVQVGLTLKFRNG